MSHGCDALYDDATGYKLATTFDTFSRKLSSALKKNSKNGNRTTKNLIQDMNNGSYCTKYSPTRADCP